MESRKQKTQKLLAAIGLLVYSIFMDGWVFYFFWHWFIAPVFHTSTILFSQALGLSMFNWALKPRTSYNQEGVKFKMNYYFAIIKPWIILFLGWLIHILF